MNVEDKLRTSSRKELDELKLWLFKENIRLLSQKNEIEESRRKFEKEKEQLRQEMSSLKRKNEFEKKRLKEETRFFDKKMKILQNGFAQLQEDRRAFQNEVDKFQMRKDTFQDSFSNKHQWEIASILFKGVNSHITLKKRYKDLMKIFHPDNVSGDQEMVQIINREYDEIKKAYEVGKQVAR